MQLEPDLMVYAVSEMTGYASDGQYFSKLFKKSTGMTPSEYRDNVQRDAEKRDHAQREAENRDNVKRGAENR